MNYSVLQKGNGCSCPSLGELCSEERRGPGWLMVCRLGWESLRQRGGCPTLGQENGVWTFLVLCRDSPIIPEMRSQFISCEVGGSCCCQRGSLAEGISLPEGTVSRCREVLGEQALSTTLKPHRFTLMPSNPLMPRQRLLVGDAFSNSRAFMLCAMEASQPFLRISFPLG